MRTDSNRRVSLAAGGVCLVIVMLATGACASSRPSTSPPVLPIAQTWLAPTATAATAPPLIGSVVPWTPSVQPSRTPVGSAMPAPTIEPGAQRPKVIQKVSCPPSQGAERPAGWGPPSAWGDTILAPCSPWKDQRFRTIAFDATSGKIRRQIVLTPYADRAIVAGDAIWLPVDGGIRRIDLASGQTTTLSIDGWSLTSGLGYVWAVQGKTLVKIDPFALTTTTVPWASPGRPVVACGFLWNLTTPEYPDQDGPSSLTRVDLNTGQPLATFKSAGLLVGPHQVEGSCLAVERLTAKMANRPDISARLWDPYVDRLILVDADGHLEPGPSTDEEVVFAGNTVWLKKLVCDCKAAPAGYYDFGRVNYFTRLNPVTHQAVGPSWAFFQTDYWFDDNRRWWESAFMEAGGAIWVYAMADDWLFRLNIPAGPLTVSPNPTAPLKPTAPPTPTSPASA